jgi:hypothetical protein
MYICKNYRPNNPPVQMPGACMPHKGQIIADLYDAQGVFYRAAIVADIGSNSLAYAQQYCDIRNGKYDEHLSIARSVCGEGVLDDDWPDKQSELCCRLMDELDVPEDKVDELADKLMMEIF